MMIVSQYFLPQPLANAEVVGGLARALGARAHDVVVVSPVACATESSGVSHRRALGRFAGDRASIAGRVIEYLAFTAGALIAGWRRPSPDVVVVPSPPLTLGLIGVALGRRHRCPVIYNVQDLYPEVVGAIGGPPGRLQHSLRRLATWIYSRSTAVVVLDDAFIPIIKRSRVDTPVYAIANGIDRGPFVSAERDMDYLVGLSVPTDRPVVMYAGNVGRSQDLDVAVDATQAAGASLIIHGDGAGLAELRERLARRSANHVYFSPYLDRSRLGDVYASADLHIVPLRPGVAWASVPSKLLSIFSAGRPAVLAAELDSPAAQVVRSAGGGWIVEPNNGSAMGDAIRMALADPAELARRGLSAARWAAEHAGHDVMAAKWERVLIAVVNGTEVACQ